MGSMIARASVDNRLVRSLLLGVLIAGAIVIGYLIAVRPEDTSLIVGAALGSMIVVATFVKPVYGLYSLVAAVFAEALFMLGSASAARLLGFLVIVAWIAHSLVTGSFRIIIPTQGWFAAAFIAWGLTSALWAMDAQRLATALLLLLQLLTLYIVVTSLVNSFHRVQIIMAIMVVVNLAVALAALASVRSGALVEGRVDVGWISGGDPNTQAAYLLPGATLLMVLFSQRARSVQKWLLLLGFSVIALAIMATSSRGALISLIAIVMLGAIIDRRLWQVALPGLLVGGLATLLLPQMFVDRLQAIVTLSDRAAGRIDIWLVALRMIPSHPILGVGLGNFERAFDRYLPDTSGLAYGVRRGMASHNIFLNVQSELGVIGLFLFAAFITISIRSGLLAVMNLRQAGSPEVAALALAAWLSLVGILIVGLFIDVQYWKLFWLLLALPEVMRRLSVESLQERAGE